MLHAHESYSRRGNFGGSLVSIMVVGIWNLIAREHRRLNPTSLFNGLNATGYILYSEKV